MRRARHAEAARKHGVTGQALLPSAQALRGKRRPGSPEPEARSKTNYVRTDEVERQVIRQRFSIPMPRLISSPRSFARPVSPISTRSVERVIEKYGLQKKTLSLPPGL